jgi:hypothetical protein
VLRILAFVLHFVAIDQSYLFCLSVLEGTLQPFGYSPGLGSTEDKKKQRKKKKKIMYKKSTRAIENNWWTLDSR